MNRCIRLFLKTRRGNRCRTAAKCKALGKVPLTGIAWLKLTANGGNHGTESKMGFDFEKLGFCPSCIAMRDNIFFPT